MDVSFRRRIHFRHFVKGDGQTALFRKTVPKEFSRPTPQIRVRVEEIIGIGPVGTELSNISFDGVAFRPVLNRSPGRSSLKEFFTVFKRVSRRHFLSGSSSSFFYWSAHLMLLR